MTPTDKVFILTPHAIFIGVITEVRRTTTHHEDITTYVVRYYDPVAGICEKHCSFHQLLDRFTYDVIDRWQQGIGRPAADFCAQIIAQLELPPPVEAD